MPSDRTPRDTEPAPGHEAQDAGSVVVGDYEPVGWSEMHWTPPTDGEETPPCPA
jgi:hypothetical protein